MRIACLVGLALAACGTDDPCDGVTTACVIVELSGAVSVDAIELDIQYGLDHDTLSLAATELPAVTSIRVTATTPLVVSVVAAGLANQITVGAGFAATAPIANGERGRLAITLEPTALACTPGTNHCGGDGLPGDPNTVYRCATTGVPTARGRCTHGCSVFDGACLPGPTACVSGYYCGGDKVLGDPQALYRCTDTSGHFVLDRECGARCEVVAPGDDDRCID